MNLIQAEAIASLYSELLSSIDREKIPVPVERNVTWTHQDIDAIYLEDGQVVVKWSRYAGCGEYDNYDTHHSLSQLFED